MGQNGQLGDLESQTDRLKQALEKFDLTFLGGLFRLSSLRSIHLVLMRRVESGRFITQAKRAPVLKIMLLTIPPFFFVGVFMLFQLGEKIVVSNVGC